VAERGKGAIVNLSAMAADYNEPATAHFAGIFLLPSDPWDAIIIAQVTILHIATIRP
jgi:hypothetical protein